MKNLAVVAFMSGLLISPLSLAGTVTKTLDVEPFQRLEVSGASSVTVRKGEVQSVSVSIEKEYLARVNTEVSNGELDLYVREKGWFGGSAKGVFEIVTPELSSVEVSGSGSVEIDSVESKTFIIELSGSGDISIGELTSESVRIELAGSGDIDVGDIAALKMKVDIMGSGDVKVAGALAKLSIDIMGSGDFDGHELDTESVKGEVIGSGSITVRTANSSDFTSIGSGKGKVLNPSQENQ